MKGINKLKNRQQELIRWFGSALITLAVITYALAQQPATSRYFYDDKGRLIKVIDSAGNAAEYIYDPAGNIVEIKRSTVAVALSIFNFSPQQGGSGTQVTINGQGFNATPSANVVKFNGTLATVVSATTTTLVVTVPAGATTGPISVTVGANTAQTSANFTIAAAPTISSVSPRFAERTPFILLRVNGAGLNDSTFSILPASAPPKVSISSASIDPTGTFATLNLGIDANALGPFTVVAANQLGSSDTSTTGANTLVIVAPGTPDIDSDGISNDDEKSRGTDPSNPDTDGDGFIDGFEVEFGSDPLNRNSTPSIPDSTKEAVSTSLSIKNLVRPSGPEAEPGETVGNTFSLKNLASPAGPDAEPKEAVGLTFSLKNLVAPAGPEAEAKECVGQPFALKNQAAPEGAAPKETVSQTFSLRNSNAQSAQTKATAQAKAPKR